MSLNLYLLAYAHNKDSGKEKKKRQKKETEEKLDIFAPTLWIKSEPDIAPFKVVGLFSCPYSKMCCTY